MIPTKYAQLTFIFIVSIFMSCVVSSVSVLNTTGLVESFFESLDDCMVKKLVGSISKSSSHHTFGPSFC